MRIIPKLVSFELDSENNLLVNILLDYIRGNNYHFNKDYVQYLVFRSSEYLLRFPAYTMEDDILSFRVDSFGLKNIFNKGIAWQLSLELKVQEDVLFADILDASINNFSKRISLKLPGEAEEKKAVIEAYYNKDYNISLFTTFFESRYRYLQEVTTVVCEDNELKLGGILNQSSFMADKDMYLLLIPTMKITDETVKRYPLVQYNQYFEVVLPLEKLNMDIDFYRILLGTAQEGGTRLLEIPITETVGDVLSIFPCKNKTEKSIFVNLKDAVFADNAMVMIDDVNVINNSLDIKGRVKTQWNSDLPSIELKSCIITHRTSGQLYECSNLIMDSNGFFSIKEDIQEENIFNLDGVYDVTLTVSQNGIKKHIKAYIDNPQRDQSSIILSPIEYIFTKSDIKRIRPYKTQNNNLSFVVRSIKSNHEVKRIERLKDEIHIVCKINSSLDLYNLISIDLVSDYVVNPLSEQQFQKDRDEFLIIVKPEDVVELVKNKNNVDITFKITYMFSKNTYVDYIISENVNDYFSKVYPVFYFKKDTSMSIFPYYTGGSELKLKIVESPIIQIMMITIDSKYLYLSVASTLNDMNLFTQNIGIITLMDSNHVIKSLNVTVRKNKKYTDTYDLLIKLSDITSELHLAGPYHVYFQTKSEDGSFMNCPLVIVDETVIDQYKFLKHDLGRDFFLLLRNNNKDLLVEILQRVEKNKLLSQMKNFIAKGLAKIVRPFRGKKVWLIGENLGQIARDNGLSFFKYCNEKNIPEDYYYVAREDNYDLDKLVPYKDRVITYDSFKHHYLYHLSKYLIVSHGIRDVIPTVYHSVMGKNNKDVIYLQHGIIAMKKLFFNSKSYNGGIKKFVVSSEQEKDILIKMMNFKDKQVMITGLPRFDYLTSKSIEKREILWMPTWREWLLNLNSDFLNSEFFKRYSALLNNEELNQILSANNITIKFVLHVEMLKYSQDFKTNSKFIKVLAPGDVDIQELIKTSKMLITDYSSITFDFAYLHKPVLFYQFDVEDYLNHRGSYVNMNKDLPGYQVKNEQQFLSALNQLITNNFKVDPEVGLLSKKYFDFIDKNNSKRVYEEIKKLGD